MKETPIWAVLCPTSPQWLEEHRDALLPVEEDAPPAAVLVLSGTGEYAGLVTFDLALIDVELPVAERAASQLGRAVYAMRPVDAIELAPDGALVWQVEPNGSARDIPEDPFAFAERLGCPLVPPKPARRVVRSAVVVEGVAPDAVRAALADYPLLSALDIRANRRGTLVTAPRGVGVDSSDIREVLPEARVIRVLHGPQPTRFAVHIGQGNAALGAFERSGLALHGVPMLHTFEGSTEPLEILAKLDVPPSALGL
jgi:hypothetical protein